MFKKEPDKFDDGYKRPIGPRGPKILQPKKQVQTPLELNEAAENQKQKTKARKKAKNNESPTTTIDHGIKIEDFILPILFYYIGSFGGNELMDMTIILKILFWPMATFLLIGSLLPAINSFILKNKES